MKSLQSLPGPSFCPLSLGIWQALGVGWSQLTHVLRTVISTSVKSKAARSWERFLEIGWPCQSFNPSESVQQSRERGKGQWWGSLWAPRKKKIHFREHAQWRPQTTFSENFPTPHTHLTHTCTLHHTHTRNTYIHIYPQNTAHTHSPSHHIPHTLSKEMSLPTIRDTLILTYPNEILTSYICSLHEESTNVWDS